MKSSKLRFFGHLEGGLLLLLAAPAAFCEYVWLGSLTGETDLGKRYSIFKTPFSPPSGQATGSFNGLHTESKFLAAFPIRRRSRPVCDSGPMAAGKAKARPTKCWSHG